MAYTGLELFMEKLKQLINSNYNPHINNRPSVLSQRPQFQLLYDELHYMIQTPLFNDERHHQLLQVRDLQKRFKDAADEAHDIVDLFLCMTANRPLATYPKRIKEGMINLAQMVCWVFRRPGVCLLNQQTCFKNKVSRNLEDVMRSIESIKKEFVTIRNNMMIDSFPRTDHIQTPSTAAAGTSCTKNPSGMKKVLIEDIVVGFDGHAELIRDKLTEDQKQLDVVSIVGMGGLGKTTLATKVFNDPFVIYHFHIRGWVTVSQTYEKHDLLIQILESVGIKPETEGDNYSQLRGMLHKRLMGNRYLIVIDDIWSTEAWDDLKMVFPNHNTRSRILLTTRLKEVALHANPHGLIHQLQYLTEDESWELLRKKVFQGDNDCPKSLIDSGMRIAKNCHGLPLTLVVIAGVLAKEGVSKESWERIGQSVTSHVVSDQTGYIETLAMSFDHLPGHLRDCFLYLGGFPEDYKFQVQRLLWLWMAEGFILQDGIRSLEEIAEDQVMELVDRNLVVVANRKSNGGIKAFYVHDLLRELCLKIATKENFYLKADRRRSIEAHKQRRIFVENESIDFRNSPRIRSLLCVHYFFGEENLIRKWSHFWMLLMVLDLRYGEIYDFPEGISQLIHLRYLAISWDEYRQVPSSICNLWSLQTLIIKSDYTLILKLPKSISNLVNLRHLRREGRSYILFPAIQKPMNLQTTSKVMLGDGAESWVKCFPGIKKLSCIIRTYMECDMESLTFLENLKLIGHLYAEREQKVIWFPASLKSLTLAHCNLPWSAMLIIQSLPNLEVLKLLVDSFVGPRWDAGEEPLRRLKFLKLSNLGIQQWEASCINFPCLKQLVLSGCKQLKEIPSEIGYIPTLELISIYGRNDYVVESLDTIQEEQHAQGNSELKIQVYNDLFEERYKYIDVNQQDWSSEEEKILAEELL